MSSPMLVLDICCPQCMAPLTQGTRVPLAAYVRDTHQEGEMRLSAVFGDYSIETELEVREGTIVEFHCPKCDCSLMLSVPCKLCGAPMASLGLMSGGYVEFCSRRGCLGHALGGFGDVDQMMRLMNRMLDTPYD
jgi:hypothetical protein